MRSSRCAAAASLTQAAIATTLVVIALLAGACSAAVSRSAAQDASAIACAGQPSDVTTDAGRTAAETRRAAEGGPLFTRLAATGGRPSCRMSIDDSRTDIEFTFSNGSTLRAAIDPQIEYRDQEVRFAAPLAMNEAVELLKAAEGGSFSSGCGVNWSQPERVDGNPSTLPQTVFRGGRCNCQARVNHAADGRALGVAFSSTC
jgi:hypothetical protein